MIHENVAFYQRSNGKDCFNCIIQNAISDIAQDFKNKVEHRRTNIKGDCIYENEKFSCC